MIIKLNLSIDRDDVTSSNVMHESAPVFDVVSAKCMGGYPEFDDSIEHDRDYESFLC